MVSRPLRALGILLACALSLGLCGASSAPETSPVPAPLPPLPAHVQTTPSSTSVSHSPPDVVGLGDSVMAGTACDCTPFLTRYAVGLASQQHTSPVVDNLGVPGLTVSELHEQLDTPEDQKALSRATTVVVMIGANDLAPLISQWETSGCDSWCVATATAHLASPLSSLLTRVRALAPHTASVIVATYWNVFEDGDVADSEYGPGFAAWSDEVTLAANAQTCAAAQSVDVQCVDLYAPFKKASNNDPTALLAGDGDHPDASGHELIAQTLLAATARRPPGHE